MWEFLFFMVIVLGFMAGAGFLYVLLSRLTRRVEPGGGDLDRTLLREEMESLSTRMERVEEELEFYKKLKAPEQPDSGKTLPGPERSAQ